MSATISISWLTGHSFEVELESTHVLNFFSFVQVSIETACL